VENVAVNTTNTIEESTTVMFTCLIEGNPAPTVTCSLNDKILQTGEESATTSSFIVDSARFYNTGRYICTANVGAGLPSIRQVNITVVLSSIVFVVFTATFSTCARTKVYNYAKASMYTTKL
jgi:hypothetical protein